MRIDITGRHVDVTPALRQLVERRLSRVERLLNDSAVSATAILTLEKYRHRTEIIVHARGDKMLRGLGEGNALEPLHPAGDGEGRAAGEEGQG